MLRYDVATPWEGMEGDWKASALYAGASAALVREVETVGATLARVEAEARAASSGMSARQVTERLVRPP